MRVPTYQAQGKRSAEVSAQQMSVRANPGALSAESQALANFGQTAARAGTQWYEQSLKAKRGADLAGAESALATRLRDIEMQSMNTNPDDVPTLYNQETTAAVAEITQGIQDPVVQRRFRAAAGTAILNKSVTVYKEARVRGIDSQIATYDQRIEELVNDVATGDRATAHKARVQLFGGLAPDGSQTAGIFEEMSTAGYIKASEVLSRRQGAEQRIDYLGAQSIINGIAIRRDPADAENFLVTLQDPKNFPNMKPEKREQLINRTNTLAISLTRAANAEAAKADKAAAKELKTTQDTNFADLMSSVRNAQQGVAGAQMPTILDVIEHQGNRTLRSEQVTALEKAILGQDAPATDTRVMASFYARLDQAIDQDEIDAVMNDALKHLGPTGDIKLTDYLSLNSYSNSLMEKTPLARDIKKHRGYLRTAIGDSDASFGTQFDPEFMGQLRADAMKTFDELVHEGVEDALTPQEAYNEVLRMFNEAKTQQLTYLAPSSTVLDLIASRNPTAANKLSNFSKWSPEDIQAAAQLVSSSPNLTPRQKILELETLQFINEAVLERIQSLDPSNDGTSNDEAGSGDVTSRSQNSGVLERLMGVFTGGGETSGERLSSIETRGQ